MTILIGRRADLAPSLVAAIAAFRHRIFVRRLGWPLAVLDELEQDQFDRPDTVYVALLDAARNVRGCARLLPSLRPTLLSEVFPHLLDGLPVPQSERVWELSRFASDAPAFTASLLAAAMGAAAARGARELLTISPLGVERLLRRMGVRAERAGRPVRIEGKTFFAARIPLD